MATPAARLAPLAPLVLSMADIACGRFQERAEG
jgi:hypothetical protein